MGLEDTVVEEVLGGGGAGGTGGAMVDGDINTFFSESTSS